MTRQYEFVRVGFKKNLFARYVFHTNLLVIGNFVLPIIDQLAALLNNSILLPYSYILDESSHLSSQKFTLLELLFQSCLIPLTTPLLRLRHNHLGYQVRKRRHSCGFAAFWLKSRGSRMSASDPKQTFTLTKKGSATRDREP